MSRMRITYEWDIEGFHFDPRADDPQAGDIVDHRHARKLDEYTPIEFDDALKMEGKRLVLVRDVGNQLDGIADRMWAYLDEDGELPNCFACAMGGETSTTVPQRFIAELKACKKRIADM